MPSEETVSVVVGGRRFTSWKSVSLSAALKEAARAFRLEAACEIGASASFRTFQAGAQVEIYFNADLVLRGYVDRYQPRISEREATVTISGRSKSADMIDSSAEYAVGKGRLERKSLKQIAEKLDQFGVGVEVGDDVDFDEIPFYQITPGETVFRAVERLARSWGAPTVRLSWLAEARSVTPAASSRASTSSRARLTTTGRTATANTL